MGLELAPTTTSRSPSPHASSWRGVHAVLRRARGQGPAPRKDLRWAGWSSSRLRRRATLDGRELNLTGVRSFTLLQVLAERAGRILSREQLMDLAKGSAEEAFDRSIDVHVSRLRQKLGDDPKRPRLLKTVRGVGYLFATPEPSDS